MLNGYYQVVCHIVIGMQTYRVVLETTTDKMRRGVIIPLIYEVLWCISELIEVPDSSSADK